MATLLQDLTGGVITSTFANAVHIPTSLFNEAEPTIMSRAEIAYLFQLLALYQQYTINGYTRIMIDDMYAREAKFVHDHSAFRMFHGGEASLIARWDDILDQPIHDRQKIERLRPILMKEPAIARKWHILDAMGYKPVQILDLRKTLNITSLLFVHKGDETHHVLPQHIPSMFVSFIPAQRESQATADIIRRALSQEQEILEESDYILLEQLNNYGHIALSDAKDMLIRLARSQTRLWPMISSTDYQTVIASEESRGKTLNVAAEVLVVGYLLNHGTHREQDLSQEPHNPEQALIAMQRMEALIGKEHLNPVSIKSGDDHAIGARDLQWNTKSFMAPVTFADGVIYDVSHGFVEGAGWKPKRDESGALLYDPHSGEVLLDGEFDAGRTGQVFAKQKVNSEIPLTKR